MGNPNTGGLAVDEQQVREILAEVNRSSALEEGQWTDKRDAPRRRLDIACTVRYLGPDGGAVHAAEGQTRDISGRGLSFVSRQHFRRATALLITVISAGGQSRRLTGTVVYSRVVREGWYLTGTRFVPIENSPLASAAAEVQSPSSTAAESERLPDAAGGDDEPQTQDGSHERSLRFLNSAASSGVSSNRQVDKIIVLSASRDHNLRRATIPALMQVTSPAGRMGLEGLLRDPNSEIQVEAAEALGNISARASIEPLKELLSHKKSDVALRVAEVLGRLGDRSGLAVVRRYLFQRADDTSARAAARTLGVIVGRRFRLNAEGIAEARRYMKKL
jgi:hypothetical protein